MSDPLKPQLVATLTDPAELDEASSEVLGRVDILEVRADLTGPVDVDWLRSRCDKPLLFTLRSRAEGGSSDNSAAQRAQQQLEAAGQYDLVDLEMARDLDRERLASIDPARRLVSWHGGPHGSRSVGELRTLLEEMSQTAARYYKLIPAAPKCGQELAALEFLAETDRTDVASFSTEPGASWTRVLAPRLGSALVYGSLGERSAAPGQLSLRQLILDYDLPELPPAHRLFGIIGNPTIHSLSPRLHNGAYRELGIDGLYVAFCAESFGDFWLEVVESSFLEDVGLSVAGLSVTTPFKRPAVAVAGATSPRCDVIESANTLVSRDGVWEAESTDPDGVVVPLQRRGIDLSGRSCAVIGAGGAGRAAALGLKEEGAEVTLFNRTASRGERTAARLGIRFEPLEDLDAGGFDVVVNATALGHDPADPLPFSPDQLGQGAAVVDMVYDSHATGLVTACRDIGAEVIEGREVLLAQAVGQFQAMTGAELPLASGAARLGIDLEPVDRQPGASPP